MHASAADTAARAALPISDGARARMPATLMNTPQREHWDGQPVELCDAWVLRKGEKVARLILVSHPLGWELRLMTIDLLRSQVCRSAEEVLATHEAWKAAMVGKGWEEQ
jgi:hypothetical protein